MNFQSGGCGLDSTQTCQISRETVTNISSLNSQPYLADINGDHQTEIIYFDPISN